MDGLLGCVLVSPRRLLRGAVFATLLALVGCFDFDDDLQTCRRTGVCQQPDGGPPDASESDAGTVDAGEPATDGGDGCPYPAVWVPRPCGVSTDYYLSPLGDNANPGTDAGAPRRTMEGITLRAGSRVHLGPGVYDGGFSFVGDGAPDCPVWIHGVGGVDGGAVVRTNELAPLRLAGSHQRLSDLAVIAGRFSPSVSFNANAVSVASPTFGPMEDVVVERVRIDVGQANGIAIRVHACTNCALLNTAFRDATTPPTEQALVVMQSPNFVLRASSFSVRDRTAFIIETSPDASVEWSTFEGCSGIFRDAGTFWRNVMTDVPMRTGVTGADRVSQNTFARLGGQVASGGVFDDNVVSVAGLVSMPLEAGGYNLFDSVQRYAADAGPKPTDVLDFADLGADLVPNTTSPAIDRADPSVPVPPGGGSRADIGALERGAAKRADGRYCLPGGAPR